jgi:hypothetical protein
MYSGGRSIRHPRVAAVLAAACWLAVFSLHPSPLFAQSVGGDQAMGFAGRGVDASHDPNGNYLVVNGSFGPVRGIHVNSSGVPVSGAFTISSGVGYSNFARVRYSPHVNGGAGGYLVVWSSEEGGSVVVRARVVARGGGAVGAESVIGGNAWLESAPAIGYSSTSKKFLVSWGGLPRTKVRLVNLDGSGHGDVVEISTSYGRDPGVTWNPHRDEFGVSFNGETANGVYSALVVVPATNAAAYRRTTFNSVVGGASFITDIDFSPAQNKYVMVWCDGLNARAAEFDGVGTYLSSDVVDFYSCAADSLGVGYNATSQTFLVAGIDPRSDNVKGMELVGRVRQGTETAPFRGLYPRAVGSLAGGGWLTSMSTPPDSAAGWQVHAAPWFPGSASPPPATPPPPAPPPPPPPPPPPTIPLGCSGLAFPGSNFVCDTVNAAWLPGNHALGGGSHTWRMIWHSRSAGYLSVWRMSGTTMAAGETPSPNHVPDTDWELIATADFNSDSHVDMLWQHRRTRLTTVWLMNGNSFIGPGLLSHNTVGDKNWALRLAADMNADGHPDLVWQHETEGYISVWLMNGLNLVEARLLNPGQVPDTDWRIMAAGNYNGDGFIDLVWQNTRTGVVTVWLMNGLNFASAGLLANNTVGDKNWRVTAAVDVDRNGTPDLIWQHGTAGSLAITFMQGMTSIAERLFNPGTVGAGWKVVGAR